MIRRSVLCQQGAGGQGGVIRVVGIGGVDESVWVTRGEEGPIKMKVVNNIYFVNVYKVHDL